MRVAVVGAGLGGVATAAGLTRSGHEVTLYERADRLREAGTAILIAPNGVRALEALGFGGYARARAVRAASGGPRDWRGRPLLIEATPFASIYVDAIACLAAPLPSFAAGRVALLGDAAHAMPPDLGQGASQAFEDAIALTRHLDGAGPQDVAGRLARYDAQRRPPASKLIRQAQRLSRLTAQTGALAWLRDAALRATPSRLAVRQAASAYRGAG